MTVFLEGPANKLIGGDGNDRLMGEFGADQPARAVPAKQRSEL